MNFILKQIRQWFMFAAVRYFAQPATQAVGGPVAGVTPLVFQNAAATPFVPDINGGPIVVTLAGVCTLNFPVPQAVQDDFKTLEVFTTTANAHVLSFGANKLNNTKTSLTWTRATAGYICTLKAFNGVWYALSYQDAAAFAQYITLA